MKTLKGEYGNIKKMNHIAIYTGNDLNEKSWGRRQIILFSLNPALLEVIPTSSSSSHFQPPLRLLLRPLYPLLVAVLTLLKLHLHHPLRHLPNKPDKITPPQCILPFPGPSLPLLPLQHLHIPNLMRLHSQIPHHRHQIKPDLPLRVPRNSPLQDLNSLFWKRAFFAGSMANRERLQPIQLIQNTIERRIGYEMVELRVLFRNRRARRFIDERRRARKGIVRVADERRIAQRLAAQVWREARREVLEGAELGPDVDADACLRLLGVAGEDGVLVEDHGEDGLRAAGVLDRLGGEEEPVVCCFAVVRAVLRDVGVARLAAGPFEEEDYAVHGAVGG